MLQLCKYKLPNILLFMIVLSVFSQAAGAQVVIKIDGSSTVYPITKAAADMFQIAQKNAVVINVDISRSGGGFKKFCEGEIDIVNASRPIQRSEMTDCRNSRVEYVEIPIAYDALTVAVNAQNYWSKTLTVAELKKIWEPAAQGKITRWNQINPTWPDEAFKLYGTSEDSGTFDYFTRAIVGKVKSSRKDFSQMTDDKALVEQIANDKNALGFLGFAYYIENQDSVTAVAINNGRGGSTLPSVETVENGSYQPLSRPIFIYVNIKAVEKPEVKEFVEFYMKNAILLVKEAKFFPLPPSAYTRMLGHFNMKRVGTVFNGVSEVGLTIDELIRREERTEFEHR